MTVSLKTAARAGNFDSMRITEGISGDLTIYSASATGYTLLTTITDGWFAQHETDRIDGTQYLAVRIAETDDNLSLMTSAVLRQMAAIGLAGLRHKLNSKINPLEDPRLWSFRCEPTGEAV